MANNGKDTIYIDIDDEITTIIEKVRASSEKIVALVLPKRATVLQSIVNMKLLKRSADAENKSLVLITAETGLLPLAGTVGLYVAKTLQTKPEIPALAAATADDVADEATLDDDEPEAFTAENAGDRPVGELAGTSAAPAAATAAADEGIETVQLDDEPAAKADEKSAAEGKKAPKEKKNKRLAVPNFERFRLFLILGALAVILLIAGIVAAATVLPKASITLVTDTSDINSSLTFTADTAAQSLNIDPGNLTVPAQIKQLQKTQNQQVPTTGQQNNGTAATGSATLINCENNPVTIASGTGISGSGLTYITQGTVTLPPGNFDIHGNCKTTGSQASSNTVDIVAQAGGTNYNTNFSGGTVAGYSSITASGSASGGTDDIIQVVAQSDIDNAKQKIAALDTSAIKQQLDSQLKAAGLFPLPVTFNAGTPTTTTSANVGNQASTVTVTQAVTYSMYGVKQSDLKTLVDNDVKDKIDPSKQSILSEGLNSASFHVNSTTSSSQQIAMSTTAVAGPDLQATTIKQQIAGKKAGEVSDMLKADPGVTNVQVHLSPFWVTSVPSKANKVTITFQKAN